MTVSVQLWGVRGSLPTPIPHEHLREKLHVLLSEAKPEDIASDEAIDNYLDNSVHAWTHGGNTSCVEVSFGDQIFILDAGTGVRLLGNQLMQDGRVDTHGINFFFTHFHWDHICGFPFFGPIYKKDKKINVYSGRSDSAKLLEGQMSHAYFPVKWPTLPCSVSCNQLEPKTKNAVAGAEVEILPLIHPDKAYGYRINVGGKSICYLTDTEISKDPEKLAPTYQKFVADSDLVIVDAMYGFLEYHEHVNFGHSNIFNWIDFFKGESVGELVIFHHDPLASDDAIRGLHNSAVRYKDLIAPDAKWTLSAAREGQRWEFE